MDVLDIVRTQIETAQGDLHNYRPESVDWNARALATADELIPWLIEIVPGMKNYVQDVLNAPAVLRSMWVTI